VISWRAARFEGGRLTLDITDLDVCEIVRDVEENLSVTLRRIGGCT
jgi:hypothetical protein